MLANDRPKAALPKWDKTRVLACCWACCKAGDKLPRKGGPGICKSDLLVINKIDLAPLVGASLALMDSDTKRMRGPKPFVFSNQKTGHGLDTIVAFIEQQGMLAT